jgi:hypothetical protein
MSHAADSLNPKRVVLNVKSLKSDEGIVKAFLRYSKHSEGEYDRNIHYIHLSDYDVITTTNRCFVGLFFDSDFYVVLFEISMLWWRAGSDIVGMYHF